MNSSRFPGVSSLEGENGCLAFTYTESDRKNFCPGATATKSVFCFDNRIIHIGTGISNNSQYPTETTIYQLRLEDKDAEAQQVRMLYDRVHRLKPFDRAIVLLWLEGISYDEIAAIVGITPSNVATRLFRIREQLKQMSNN